MSRQRIPASPLSSPGIHVPRISPELEEEYVGAGYDDPLADVVLVTSDSVELRVPSYCLKAASHFFLELLNAGTKGGPIPLEATSVQLEFLVDRVTGKLPRMNTLKAIARRAPPDVKKNGWDILWSLLELDVIADKYLLLGVREHIRHLIACFANENPPATLAFACQCFPPDAECAIAALKAFEDEMPSWMSEYFAVSSLDRDCLLGLQQRYFSPKAPNISKKFAASLGLDGFHAYTCSLEAWSTVNPEGGRTYNWKMVARCFAFRMKMPSNGRSWLLHRDDISEHSSDDDL